MGYSLCRREESDTTKPPTLFTMLVEGAGLIPGWGIKLPHSQEQLSPHMLIKLISAGQESGRRGTADTRLAKLLGEMALINHPKGERQKVI